MTWISHKNYSANPDEYKYAADGSKTTEESKGGPAVGRPVATEDTEEIASRFETSPILIVATAPGYEKGAKWQQLNFLELANENFKPTIMSVLYYFLSQWFCFSSCSRLYCKCGCRRRQFCSYAE